MSMLGQLWGFSVSELLYSRAMVSPSQRLLRRNVSILPKHCAPTPVPVLFPVSNRSICCSSTVPGMQPSIPPWSAQKSWKSKRSAFTPATSKKSSRIGSASETGIGLVVFLCTINCPHSAFSLVLADYHCVIPTGSTVGQLPVDSNLQQCNGIDLFNF